MWIQKFSASQQGMRIPQQTRPGLKTSEISYRRLSKRTGGGRQSSLSLSFLSVFSRRERPLLAGKERGR